jgi:hypothetical protein
MSIASFSSKFFSICFTVLTTLTPVVTSPVLADTIEPPPGSGAPSGTVGGGSRPVKPPCLPPWLLSQSSLIALIPGHYLTKNSSRPKFVIQVPETIRQSIGGRLTDAQLQATHHTDVTNLEQFETINIKLSKPVPTLKIRQRYSWITDSACHQQNQTESRFASR